MASETLKRPVTALRQLETPPSLTAARTKSHDRGGIDSVGSGSLATWLYPVRILPERVIYHHHTTFPKLQPLQSSNCEEDNRASPQQPSPPRPAPPLHCEAALRLDTARHRHPRRSEAVAVGMSVWLPVLREYTVLGSALLGSMFAGASCVHYLLQPDLSLTVQAPQPSSISSPPATASSLSSSGVAQGAPGSQSKGF